jgi:small subunit ribosomal protein S13
MARIVGVDIPNEKRIEVALTYIYGIGPATAKLILAGAKVNPDTRVKDLAEAEIAKLYEFIDKNLVVEGTLRQKIFQNIKRLKDIRSYRGNRHKVSLPVRGQNTKKNAKTRKGRNAAVAMVKKVAK